jgi:hypothetical protein
MNKLYFKNITNDLILNIGRDYHLSGSCEGILYDGDLEEFLSDNDIIMKMYWSDDKVKYCKDSGEILNCTEGEEIGFYIFTQGNTNFFIPEIAGRYASDLMDIYLNFNKIKTLKEM